jgi:hypothetical protein
MMGDIADYYANQEIGEDFPEDLYNAPLLAVPRAADRVMILQHVVRQKPPTDIPRGHWRQRNGELIRIPAMGLQHLANTLRMLDRNLPEAIRLRSQRWRDLRDEWLSRGHDDEEWRKDHFSQETYEKMLKTR